MYKRQTKVSPVSLSLNDEFGKQYKILLVEEVSKNLWKILIKKPKIKIFKFSDGLECEIFNEPASKEWFIKFNLESKLFIDRFGMMPIPPYLNREPDINDFVDYQTVYAKKEGSIAAPTAGLHFDEELLDKIKKKGLDIVNINLSVGAGTFQPVKVDEIKDHNIHEEFVEVEPEIIDKVKKTKAKGKKVIAVGTTATRALETAFLNHDKGFKGYTKLFIYPGFEFKAIDLLITNFHLPKSSLLMLVSAFIGFKNMKNIYQIAIEKKYRFLSYGDAMLLKKNEV